MLATADRKPNKHMPFVLIAMFAFFIHTNSVYDYYLAGVIGVLLADVVYHKRLPEIKSKAVGIIVVVLLVLVGLWMGGYPNYVTPSGAYIYLAVISLYNNGGYAIIHLVGVLLILLACFIWQQLELPDFLSAKGLMWLGKNCYGIFLVHTLLIEYLGLPLMTALYEGTGNLVTATILVYVILLVAILVVAEIFNRTVEKFVNRLLEAR
jgi:peptidoglycan/LPS O-acetylase OafA/YrhL